MQQNIAVEARLKKKNRCRGWPNTEERRGTLQLSWRFRFDSTFTILSLEIHAGNRLKKGVILFVKDVANPLKMFIKMSNLFLSHSNCTRMFLFLEILASMYGPVPLWSSTI